MFGNADQPYLITCTLIPYFLYSSTFPITYMYNDCVSGSHTHDYLSKFVVNFYHILFKKIFNHYMFLPPLSNLFQIRMNNYPSFSGVSSFESFPPTANQCDVPSAYCIRSFFCKRNSAGMCTSGNLGPCSY